MQLAIKILLLFVDGLLNGFLVEKYTACEIHRKSDFGWHLFQKVAYCTSPCLMRKEVEKSQAILDLRDGFQDYFSKLLRTVVSSSGFNFKLLHDWRNFDLPKLTPVEHISLMPSSCLSLTNTRQKTRQ